MTIKRLSPTVQVEYTLRGQAGRLVCHCCGTRTTNIWTTDLPWWIPDFLAAHDGQRDCTVPDYGERK